MGGGGRKRERGKREYNVKGRETDFSFQREKRDREYSAKEKERKEFQSSVREKRQRVQC